MSPYDGVELFIGGQRLQAKSPLVTRHLRHDEWRMYDDSTIRANRIVLPSEQHYRSIAVMIAVELLKNGAAISPASAFGITEPLIELSLQKAALDDEVITGVLGELLFLKQLLESSIPTTRRVQMLESWRGFDRYSRDFEFDPGIAVEVKTTTGLRSAHHISSVGQVDPARSTDGVALEKLYLLSVGIVNSATGVNEFSLVSLVEEILALLDPAATDGQWSAIQELFLERLSHYGPDSRPGYSHEEMSSWGTFRKTFAIRFARAYLMNDPEVGVMRYSDLAKCACVAQRTVQFEVVLPETISPSNPVTSIGGFVESIAAQTMEEGSSVGQARSGIL
jgi:hypothetical protein